MRRKLGATVESEGISQYEIAKRLGISRARVSQIEARALAKIYRGLKRAGLLDEERPRGLR